MVHGGGWWRVSASPRAGVGRAVDPRKTFSSPFRTHSFHPSPPAVPWRRRTRADPSGNISRDMESRCDTPLPEHFGFELRDQSSVPSGDRNSPKRSSGRWARR